VDIPKLALMFFLQLSALQTVWCGKASCHGAIFKELAFPIDYAAMNNPKCETRTSGYLL